jgi:hypothetical protein
MFSGERAALYWPKASHRNERKFRLIFMPRSISAFPVIFSLLLILSTGLVRGQQLSAPASGLQSATVRVTVVDETGQSIAGAQVSIHEPGLSPLVLRTDFAGHCDFTLRKNSVYQVLSSKPGYYQNIQNDVDPRASSIRIELAHEQIVQEQVNVTDSAPGIDVEQTSGEFTMNTPEIVNIPYTTSRDIRNLLPFNPGVVADSTGQVHVSGSETWQTLDQIDGFDVRSPIHGVLGMRVSPDAVRTIVTESTRYPVEFGRATGGVIGFYTGMGDDKFRFNATNFVPSFRSLNGIRFDKFVPRVTFSGPLVRQRAWFFDGLEAEWDNIYIVELPANANSNELVRGSNLFKIQDNLTSSNILTGGLLFNAYHSPYDGISSLTPQQSTTKRNTHAWLPYVRDKWSFAGGALLDTGFGVVRVNDGYEPHGNAPYQITPELPSGSYFENLTGHSQREEGSADLYVPPRRWAGQHDLKFGFDVRHTGYSEGVARTPVSYLREDRTLLRRSVFPAIPVFTLNDFEVGGYAEDRWRPGMGMLIEPGLRFDWDEIIRRPLVSPRVSAVYSPLGASGTTKLSAGVGLYYEHTQLEYLTRALEGGRQDTYYAADGVTPTGPAQPSSFTANYGSLHQARAINWSLGIEQKIPWSILFGANFLQKRTSNVFTYVNQSGPSALYGNYLLTNQRQDHYDSFEVEARRFFSGGHTLFISYTHSSARTNATLDYVPTISQLGPQQSGPLPWDTPNRIISWGWMPVPLPRIRNRWDFVYTVDGHTGFPYTAMNANQLVVGAAGGHRFPAYFDISPGLEWKFHFRGSYFGLRGVLENATDRTNPTMVNNVVDSPQFGTFSQFQGRALTARIRLIGAK